MLPLARARPQNRTMSLTLPSSCGGGARSTRMRFQHAAGTAARAPQHELPALRSMLPAVLAGQLVGLPSTASARV